MGEADYRNIIQIDSISNFDNILDSCIVMVNATLKGEGRKGFWSITYEISNVNQVKITDIAYISGDFQ